MNPNLKTIEKLFSSIEIVFGIDMQKMQSISRIRIVTDARKATTYFLRTHFKMKDDDIAKIINKDRSVVGYMFNGAESLIKYNTEFRNKIDKINSDTEIGILCPSCHRPLN